MQLSVNSCALNIVQYQWSPSTGLSDPNIQNPVASPTVTTTYTVTGTDANFNNYSDDVTITVNNGGCHPRRVLFEEFTNASNPFDSSANLHFDSLMALNPDKVAVVKFHTSWIGFDPFYNYNSFQNDERVNFYGINAVPDTKVDGLTNIHPGAMTQAVIDNRYNLPTPVLMGIEDVRNGMQVDISLDITIDAVINDPLAVFVAVIEDLSLIHI